MQTSQSNTGMNPYQGSKNKVINGNMNIWQRGTSFVSPTAGDYTVDRFKYFNDNSVADFTISRDTDVPNDFSLYSLKVDCTTIDASIGTTDNLGISHRIEGYNFFPFKNQKGTLSFWVKAVKTGIYCVSFRNKDEDNSYVSEYTINSASTWEKKTITVDFSGLTGGWDYTTGVGVDITWAIAVGSTYQTTPDSWQVNNMMATSNQVNGADSTANNFWLSQVQLEVGEKETIFENRRITEEIADCQRYYVRFNVGNVSSIAGSGFVTSTTTASIYSPFPVKMRGNPIFGTGGNFQIYDQGASTVTGSTIYNPSTFGSAVNYTCGGAGLTLGRGCFLRAANDITAYTEFDAEL